jgi:hypothetical protein
VTPRHKPVRNQGISTNARWIAIVAPTVVIVVWMSLPPSTKPLPEIQCSDGPRRLVDATQFATQYWAYSVKLEGSLANKAKISTEIEPKQLQQLSEAMQQGNEFRKWLVNSYNACALLQADYKTYGISFQAMDQTARNIQEVLDRGVNTDAERSSLTALVNTYLQQARGLQQPSTTPRNNP